ncbi:DMT family transporter [Roseobacter sp. HKCCA0434]|uniref:DMT family transporter n=1 Tax=Roseobacter sp. HKCCA0434 TaxID=3079297 RepID=UPI002905B2C3|nr:DMT family transporter [Roseobacter sp. HKCCA0434]
MLSSNRQGAVLALAGFAAFASHDALIKLLGGGYAIFQIAFFSVLFGFPIMMMMLIRDGARDNLRPHHPWWVALRTGLGIVTGFGAFYAFTTLPLTQVYAILFSQPLIITALSVPMLGERVGPRRWAAVVLGLIGVMVVLRPGATELGWGHVAALTSGITGSFVSIIMRRIGSEERSIVMILYPMMGNLIVMGAIMPFVYRPMPIGDLGLVAALSVLGFCGMLGVLMGYQRAAASTVAPMQYSQILWAVLFGALFFDEWPEAATLLGAGIIIASGLYIAMREEDSAVTVARPVSTGRTLRGDTAFGIRVGDILRRRAGRDGPLSSDRE